METVFPLVSTGSPAVGTDHLFVGCSCQVDLCVDLAMLCQGHYGVICENDGPSAFA